MEVRIYSPGVTPTKVRVLEAAVELLGTEGLRSLTHARVDEQAGLPKGSTSNYFRTRAQLVTGVSNWISERELTEADDMAAAPPPSMTAARLTLFMEANHNADIRAAVSQTRSVMEHSIVAAMARLGAADPYAAGLALMACCEGIILHRIARHDDTDARPLLRLVVNAALPCGVRAPFS